MEEDHLRAGKVKPFATELNGLGLISRTHVVERENCFLQVVSGLHKHNK